MLEGGDSIYIITENQLDEWVRGNAQIAQGLIVELTYRLVAASCPRPSERRFPLGDSIGQPGPDGYLNTDSDYNPFVPNGRSYWEIGTSIDAGAKATSDYRDLTAAIPEQVRQESTFVFVTPLSGRRDWPYSWKEDAQARWLESRRHHNEWRDVRVIDGSVLIDWMHHWPAVEQWFGLKMDIPVDQMQTPESRWAELRTIGEPPPLPPHLFLANRSAACEKLKDIFSGTILQLKLDTHFPEQMVNFVAAYIESMDEEAKVEIAGRCLIITGIDAWNAIAALREPHILIAEFDLDDTDSSGTRLLEKAHRAHHAVIYGGRPGGVPHPNRASITNPKSYQIKEALEKAGYKEERARTLAQYSGGNLNFLLRCIQGLSTIPEWAQGADAAELAIAQLLGSWSENYEGDKAIAEELSGKAYGEWIGRMREIVLKPGTPLTQREGAWKFVSRYEGWYELGPGLFNDHLERLKSVASIVLCERDPKFELPPNDRCAAGIYGKKMTHSHLLRKGLAESLALIGSYPDALISCSSGKAELTANLGVREILTDTDWILWASLDNLLPLLAEAAPREFLAAVENALGSDPCPFDILFAQENVEIMGNNYITGLLWALETLAWDSQYLIRVVVILGELAARDPGGNWANRPKNSLSTILLPWLPQTCAPVIKRRAAVEALLREVPEVAWNLLLALLPSFHQVSSGSARPSWRKMIPDDWSGGATTQEYWDQIIAYTELAIEAAKQDISKLVELIDRMDDLQPASRHQLLTYLSSEAVISMPQANRLRLWNSLVDLVSRHRKFADAEWAMNQEAVDEISGVAERLAPESPKYRHQRLFGKRDFLEEMDNYEEQYKKLDEQRQKAVNEVFLLGGIEAVLEFSKDVESPWIVGSSFGMVATRDAEENILPALLESETNALSQLAGGFVWGRFRQSGWQWVDGIDMSLWTPSQKGQLLAYLPFAPDTWKRASLLLEKDEAQYWSKTNVNPYETEEGLEQAVDLLIHYGRPNEAIRCLERLKHAKRPLNSQQAVHALQAVLNSSRQPNSMDTHAIVEIIKTLQDNPDTNYDDLFQIEWTFLPLLDRHLGASPKVLEQRLADDPAFFCEVIRTIFRSTKEERPAEEPTELQKSMAKNAYRLLREWRKPPGIHKDGTFSGDTLASWLEAVKEICTKSGHMEVASTMIGQVLIYAPPDPDGLWLHHSVAEILNAKESNDMRDGFRTALFNSRGVHWGSGGRAEHELAKKYMDKAEEVEAHGYQRLADSLRELAETYEREAELEAKDPFEFE
jgi:hypothetical protein